MSEQEKIERLEVKVTEHDVKFDLVMQKLDNAIEESRRSRESLEKQNEMRAAEIRDYQARTDAAVAEIRAEVAEINRHINTMSRTNIYATAAMVVGLIIASFFK